MGAQAGTAGLEASWTSPVNLALLYPAKSEASPLRVFMSQRNVMQAQIMYKTFMSISFVVAEISGALCVHQYENRQNDMSTHGRGRQLDTWIHTLDLGDLVPLR